MKSLIAAILATISPVLLLAVPSDDGGAGTSSSHRAITWSDRASGEEIHGLYAIQLRPDSMVETVLAEVAGHRPVLIRQVLTAPAGLRTTEVVDVATGWRAALERRAGISRPTLQQLFRASAEIEVGDPIALRLVLPDGTGLEAEVPLELQEQVHADFVRELANTESIGTVVEAVPRSLYAALFFLDRSLSPNPLPDATGNRNNIAHGLRDVVEILAGALREAGVAVPAEADRPWTMKVGPSHRGLEVDDPELRELVVHFRGVTDLSVGQMKAAPEG